MINAANKLFSDLVYSPRIIKSTAGKGLLELKYRVVAGEVGEVHKY